MLLLKHNNSLLKHYLIVMLYDALDQILTAFEHGMLHIIALYLWLARNPKQRIPIFGYPIEETVGVYFFHQNLYSYKLGRYKESLGNALMNPNRPKALQVNSVLDERSSPSRQLLANFHQQKTPFLGDYYRLPAIAVSPEENSIYRPRLALTTVKTAPLTPGFNPNPVNQRRLTK